MLLILSFWHAIIFLVQGITVLTLSIAEDLELSYIFWLLINNGIFCMGFLGIYKRLAKSMQYETNKQVHLGEPVLSQRRGLLEQPVDFKSRMYFLPLNP